MAKNTSKPDTEAAIMERLALIEKRVRSNRIPFSNGGGIEFIPAEDILYVRANSNYSYLFFQDGSKLLISQPIKNVEQLLEDFNFFRIHDSYLINLKHLKRYSRGDGGGVVLSNNEKLPVSRGKKVSFLNRIKTDFFGVLN